MPFDSPDVDLRELLDDVAMARAQLPDFQREWKWDTDRIASLLASVSLGHPVGVVMMLEVGGDHVGFASCLLAGVNPSLATTLPGQLVLDGQQRLTSLYQSLRAELPVSTTDLKGKRIERWYYLDMAKALDPDADREDAIVAVPEDRKLRDNFGKDVVADYSTTELECSAEMFPLSISYDSPAVDKWMVTYLQLDSEQMPTRLARWSTFKDRVLGNLISYKVPVIVLKKETPREAVCTVFEKVNTGGVVLNVFELLTATFAAAGYQLKEDWQARRARLYERSALRGVESTDFLQAVTLLAAKERRDQHLAAGKDLAQAPGISCRRKEILRLELKEYERWKEPVTEALLWAAQFLAGERVFEARDLPYRTQLVPLAAIRAALGNDAETVGATERIRRWYWSGVLGELYGGSTETRFARDLPEVVAWVRSEAQEPTTVQDAMFSPARLLTLRSRLSAAYKGIYALLMRAGCQDWLYEQPIDVASFFDIKLDIHHIFPKHWCNQNHVDGHRRESIVNKTAISATTNRVIGGRAPSVYLSLLAKRAKLDDATLDGRVHRHAIDPATLRADDFDAFFAARTQVLLELISDAIGKPVATAIPDEDMRTEVASYEEEPEDPSDDALDLEAVS